jgi:N-acetyl-gamma-glutamyl-phosphate reductase
MPARLQTAVVGATGYAGFELARLLLRHPRVQAPLLLQRGGEERGPKELSELFPHVSGNGNCPLEPFSWSKLRDQGVNLLFLATPHDVSREFVPEALNRGLRVIDLSGAWRLKRAEHLAVYGFKDADPAAAAKMTEQAVYGLPELNRQCLAEAPLVANPGCYATSIILALAPLLQAGLVEVERGVVCDSKSGASGAGKQPSMTTHFVEVADNLSAYSVFKHRHVGEILEQLHLEAEEFVFVPHLLPIPRGILSTIYVRLRTPMTAASVEACLRHFYRESAWVRVFAASKLPQIQFSLRTNFCDLGFCLSDDGRRLVLVSCLDNLVKGAAGQAVQNMNVMYGWSEQEGLQ